MWTWTCPHGKEFVAHGDSWSCTTACLPCERELVLGPQPRPDADYLYPVPAAA